jgi:hypothetical protein
LASSRPSCNFSTLGEWKKLSVAKCAMLRSMRWGTPRPSRPLRGRFVPSAAPAVLRRLIRLQQGCLTSLHDESTPGWRTLRVFREKPPGPSDFRGQLDTFVSHRSMSRSFCIIEAVAFSAHTGKEATLRQQVLVIPRGVLVAAIRPRAGRSPW